jgi:hypothetical protein
LKPESIFALSGCGLLAHFQFCQTKIDAQIEFFYQAHFMRDDGFISPVRDSSF